MKFWVWVRGHERLAVFRTRLEALAYAAENGPGETVVISGIEIHDRNEGDTNG